jgi:hypothetical protein
MHGGEVRLVQNHTEVECELQDFSPVLTGGNYFEQGIWVEIAAEGLVKFAGIVGEQDLELLETPFAVYSLLSVVAFVVFVSWLETRDWREMAELH